MYSALWHINESFCCCQLSLNSNIISHCGHNCGPAKYTTSMYRTKYQTAHTTTNFILTVNFISQQTVV